MRYLCPSRFMKILRHLCCLTRAGLANDNDCLILFHQVEDVVSYEKVENGSPQELVLTVLIDWKAHALLLDA